MQNGSTLAHRGPYWAMVTAHFLNDGFANYLPGVLPAIAVSRHVPIFWLGFLVTAMLMGQILQPVFGVVADRVGGRWLMLGGPALSVAGIFIASATHSFALMVAGLLLIGLGSTIFHPQALAAARGLAGERTGLSMSGFLVGGELGRALSPLAAGLVVVAFGLDHLWLIALPFFVVWPWVLRTVPAQPKRLNTLKSLSWRRHLRPAAGLLSFTAFRAGAISATVTLVPLLFHQEGGTLVLGASLVTTFTAVGIFGNLLGGMLRDRVPPISILWGSTLAAAVLIPILLAVQHFWLWPVLALFGVALFSSLPVTMILGQDIFPENPALGSGVALGLGNSIGALLLLPISAIAQHAGIATGLWLVLVLVGLSTLGIVQLTPILQSHTSLRPSAARP